MKGLTLIEAMVIFVIIAILMALAIPKIFSHHHYNPCKEYSP